MAELLLLILFIIVILLLCVGFDRIYALPFLNPSRHEVRDLLVALEDFLLPMGSFPIRLLHSWASTLEARQESPTVVLRSLQPTTAGYDFTPTKTYPSVTPASDNSASNLTAATTSTAHLPIESGPNTVPKPHPIDLSTIDASLDTTKIPPPANLIPDNSQSTSSEDYDDLPFFDSLEYQQSLDDDAQLAKPGISLPQPEQQGAVLGPLGGGTTVPSEEEDHQQQQREGEQNDRSTVVLEQLLSEAQAFETAICELVDPDGIYGLDLKKMIELVDSIVKGQAAAQESLRSEKVRSQRAEEDLRHWWEDLKEVFERVINGQNASLRWTQQKYDEVLAANETLQKENDLLQKYGRMRERYINNLKTLKEAKEWAEQEATTLKAEVESRIHAVEERHRQERLATQESTTRERNTLLCQMRMVQDSLNDARHQMTLGERKHKAELRESYQYIEKQEKAVKDLTSRLAVSDEVSAAAEQRLQKRMDLQLQERNGEITSLRSELRESKATLVTLRAANISAERGQRKAEQMSNHWKEEATTLCNDKEYVVSGLHFDKKVMRRTIDELVVKITVLESEGEVKGLQSQLEGSKKDLQESMENAQDAKTQLRKQKRQMKNLQDTIKKIKEDLERSFKENGDLKTKLEQASRVTNSGLKEQARKLKVQEEECSRKLEVNRKEVVEIANSKAAEDAKKMEEEHEKDKRDALDKAAKTENDLRIEIESLKSQVQQAVNPKSSDPASAQPGSDAEELIVQTREADEANNLLLEIGTHGIVQGTLEHAVLQELGNAKLALYSVKCELRKRGVTADKEILLSMISGGKMDEQYIQQLDTTKWMQLAKQAKATQAKLPKVESMLGTTGELQTDAILQVINGLYREIKKARVSKRGTQRTPRTLPPISSTSVQAAGSAIHSNMMSDMSGEGVPGSAGEGPSSSTSQAQGDQRKSALGFNWNDLNKKHPVWAGVNFDMHKEGSGEAAMPQASPNAEPSSAQHIPFSEFHSGSHPPFQPLKAADNFPGTPSVVTNNAQNPKPMGRSTQVKRDYRPPFADLIASLGPPASSVNATTAVVPEPVSNNANNNITSDASPVDVPAKAPQKSPASGQSPLPGLLTNIRTDDRASVNTTAKTPQNSSASGQSPLPGLLTNIRTDDRASVNTTAKTPQKSSVGGQSPLPGLQPNNKTDDTTLVTLSMKTPQESSAGGQSPFPGLPTHSGTDDTSPVAPSNQTRTTQQGGLVDSPQQDHPSHQPKGWTADMTNSVEALLDNGYTSVDQIVSLLEGDYENFSAIEGVKDYVRELKSKIEDDSTPEMPVGWTDSMSGTVRDMLQEGDDVEMIADFMMSTEDALQTNDTKCVEQWVKKLESDYESEVKGRTQQD